LEVFRQSLKRSIYGTTAVSSPTDSQTQTHFVYLLKNIRR